MYGYYDKGDSLLPHLEEVLPRPQQAGACHRHVERLLHVLQHAEHVLCVAAIVDHLAVQQRLQDLGTLGVQRLHAPFELRRHP
jgi:hypothetical protein